MGGKIFERNPENRRKLGRLILRWLDDVQNDLSELEVKRWM
jgi:hypothetical protein